jgi:hypothetical protein
MSEFIKIGEAANMFNILGNADTSSISSVMNSNAITGKKSGNGLAIVAGIVLVGIVGYELYLHFERKRKEGEG